MFTTQTRAGIEILINPAHVADVLNTPDGPELTMSYGKKYCLPREEYPIIRAALNGNGETAPHSTPAWVKDWNDEHNTAPRVKRFTPLY